MCDNPNCDHGPTFFQDQNTKIEINGYTYVAVGPGNGKPGFVYTVGLSEKGKADLIFVGASDPQSVQYLMGAVAHQMANKDLPMGLVEPTPEDEIADGMIALNGFAVPYRLVCAQDKLETHAFGAARRLEAIESDLPPRLVQVVMPDFSGRFPDEAGYNWVNQQVHPA